MKKFFFKPLTEPEEWAWVKKRAHPICCQDSQGIVAYAVDTGDIAAIVVLDSFTTSACNAHIAVDNPMVIRHGFLNEVARHVFIDCGRKYMFGLVPDNNPRALKFDAHIGFREVARVPDAFEEGVGYVVMRMDADNNRWVSLPAQQKEAA